MRIKYLVGRSMGAARDRLLAVQYLPLIAGVPFDRCWPYDVARYAGTRDLGFIVDVGANAGQTALYLRRFFPGSTLHCFEPVPETFLSLERAVRAMPRIHAHPMALSRKSGALSMRIGVDSETSAVTNEQGVNTCQVRARTLDDFAKEAVIERIGLLKIDVEGHEIPVLEGAAGLLAERRIQAVYIEVGTETGDPAHTHFSLVHAALEPHGFVFSGLYEAWRHPERYRMGFANALYWNPGFRR